MIEAKGIKRGKKENLLIIIVMIFVPLIVGTIFLELPNIIEDIVNLINLLRELVIELIQFIEELRNSNLLWYLLITGVRNWLMGILVILVLNFVKIVMDE